MKSEDYKLIFTYCFLWVPRPKWLSDTQPLWRLSKIGEFENNHDKCTPMWLAPILLQYNECTTQVFLLRGEHHVKITLQIQDVTIDNKVCDSIDMKANCILFKLSQYFRNNAVAPRERLIIHSGYGLVGKSMRTATPHLGWYVISCAAGIAFCLWLFIL